MNSDSRSLDSAKKYRHVYALESRDWWSGCRDRFDPRHDIVLTYDLGLRRDVESLGGVALYIDHLVDPACMEQNNLLTYEFIRTWHLDADGKDLFTFRDVPFGFCFRIELWNDLIFHARTRLCLERIKALSFDALFVGTRDGLVESLLGDMGVAFVAVTQGGDPAGPAYFFPIHRWMDEKLRSRKLRHQLKPLVATVLRLGRLWFDRIGGSRKAKPGVFVQEYYPTRQILQRLQRDSRLRVVLAQYSWAPGIAKLFSEHPIPVWGSVERFRAEAERLMRRFREQRCSRLVLSGGLDVTDGVFNVIEERIGALLADTLRMLDCVIRYLDRNPIQLEVMISNIGRMNTLVDCVCKSRGVRSYLIINGMLAHAYLDEGKYADIINAYSAGIRDNYFRGMNNIVCLGDPRMDDYANVREPRSIDRKSPTVTIGASGYNVTNLNSYVAVEFEFLRDVLRALSVIREQGVSLRIVIKVRDNGYREQYEAFVKEYFPGLVDEILDAVPIRKILERTDFYLSIYSQTLFEASCLGIPCLYYKKDTETLFAPFDGRSELVMANSVEDLIAAFADFLQGHERFDAFLRRSTMEKYIGFLDGGNLERNLQYIYDLLDNRTIGESC